MKNKLSLFALLFIILFYTSYRFVQMPKNDRNGYNAVSWDGLGYYMYLPSILIYHDVKDLKWVPHIDSIYGVTGGVFYQASKLEKGTYTNKYLGGVSIIQAPYFFIGHQIADYTGTVQDGFSWPYQYSLIFGLLFWGLLGFVFIRKILLNYFNDKVVAITLILLALCSNLIQYIAVDPVQSHCSIFTLYAILIWCTIKWHQDFKIIYAFFIGLTCGLTTICRPTELIIIFIPILWNTYLPNLAKEKWRQVCLSQKHLIVCFVGGLIGIAPQLIYWKYTTGSFIYDVGSKWYFLNPYFRVLFGAEKGWFLYTPIAIAMVAGLFCIKNFPFQKAIIIFCLLNIWIIIAWSDWRYGGSYSTRALVQSYPVFSFPLAAIVSLVLQKKKLLIMFIIAVLLIVLNFYQLDLYNRGYSEKFSPLLDVIYRLKLFAPWY